MPAALNEAEAGIMTATAKANQIDLMTDAVKSENHQVKETIEMQKIVLEDAERKKAKLKEAEHEE